MLIFVDADVSEQQRDMPTPANDVTAETVNQELSGGMEPITEEESPSDEIVHSAVEETPQLPPERIDTRSPTDTSAG